MAERQLIIALGREFGSGGHEIGVQLAERFGGLPLYDRNLLQEISKEHSMDVKALEQYDELPKNRLLFRTVNGFSNAPEDGIAQMQFQFLQERAAAGASFVAVGRCAEEKLQGAEGLVTIFVMADHEFKLRRTMEQDGSTEAEASALMERIDWKRKRYHNQYCHTKWGDARNYDITINSGRLGIQGTVEVLEHYIRMRQAAMQASGV